jgi:Ca2+-binding RTX toxin-like protein
MTARSVRGNRTFGSSRRPLGVVFGSLGLPRYVLGGQGDDQLSGQNGSNRLKGGPDNEIAMCRTSDRQPRQCAGGKRKDILTTGGIEGGNQNDWMSGGEGDDDLFGDETNDSLKTRDHVSATDEANGGPATDKCVIDAGDTANSCEQ